MDLLKELLIYDIDALTEARAFRRKGNKIQRAYRCSAGRRKGRVVQKISDCFKRKDLKRARKARISSRRTKFARARKSKITRRKASSKLVRRLNKNIKRKKR